VIASKPTGRVKGGWSDEVLVLAATDVSGELPSIGLQTIVEAAEYCREHVRPNSGPAHLRHCIRQRALGLTDIE
jgi:hypothetical protein